MIEKMTEMLNEEKWTRATINSYSVSNFEDLDDLLNSDLNKNDWIKIKENCDEHLGHTKNSIIALYISGIISLEKHLIDDSNIIQLINLFYDNRKWQLVEFLCLRLLKYGENGLALRSLSECFDNLGKEEEKFAVWERLIKVDYEEIDLIKQIADRYEEQNDLEKAVFYFKKALHRYINTKNFTQIKDIWQKLLIYNPEDFDNQINIILRVAKLLNKDRASQMLEGMYDIYFTNNNWDKSIYILKEILLYQPNNADARERLITCYRSKYADHSKIEDYIEKTNLTQSYRDINAAIADFEKHISFDQGTFVHHKTWGIGRIQQILEDSLVIDFIKKRNHPMSLKMAVNALNVLLKNHIWVIKSIFPKEKLKDKIKQDVLWTLRTIIASFNNSASLKQIKAEIVPSILTANEWLSWNTAAKKLLKTDPYFGVNPDKPDEYSVRETPVSYEEKTLNMFKAEKDFFQKVKILREFLDNSDPESDYFAEIFSYFISILKSFANVTDTVVTSYLIVKRLVKSYPFLNQNIDVNFAELLDSIQNIDQTFAHLPDAELKRSFLEEIMNIREDWDLVYKQLFPYYLSSFIIDEFESHEKTETLIQLFKDSYSRYKEMPEMFLWLVKNYDREFWKDSVEVNFEKILLALLHLLDISNRAVSSKRDVSFNRKIGKIISGILFTEKNLHQYLYESDRDSIKRVYSLVKDVDELDPAVLIELKHIIMERFPEFIFHGENSSRTTTVSGGLLVTQKMYDLKHKQLQTILEVDIPQNSQEIGEARLLGDLRENAEYKAGKERQELLNISLGKLTEDLDRAVIVKQEDINIAKISYGTIIQMTNLNKNSEETFTILGPWESKPAENVISYLAPFGSKLLNNAVGDEIQFIINEREYSYRINSINAVTL
ncbi:MAG: transcription elongation factor GreA [Bacteroidetes bacterium]|nr:transcription elongation factor GreA [Bacteroidota bacterium]